MRSLFYVRHRNDVSSCALVLGGNGRIYDSGAFPFPSLCVGSNQTAENDRRLQGARFRLSGKDILLLNEFTLGFRLSFGFF